MDIKIILDYVATGFSLVLYGPGLGSQIFLNIKRRSTKGLSPFFVHALPVSVGLWFAWGIAWHLWPAIVTNFFGLLLSSIILVQYYTLPKEK